MNKKDKQNFKVTESVMNGKYKKCILCDNNFKLGQEIVLHPIQEPIKGFSNVECIVLHKNCYWIKDESEGCKDKYDEEITTKTGREK